MSEIVFKSVSKSFGDTKVIENLNLTLREGEFTVLVGASGCGKTTLLRMIAGIGPATSGEIFMDGVEISKVPPGKRDIAMVFQNYAIYPTMTVRGNIEFGLINKKVPKEERRRRIDSVAETVGLTPYLDRKPSELSGGQRQRVAIARALANDPPLLLADEPTGNLDTAASVEIMELFSQLHKEGTTVVVVTHEEEIAAFTERIIRFRDGEIVSDKPNVPREPEQKEAGPNEKGH